MDGGLKDKWVKALRSGHYEQGVGVLLDYDDDEGRKRFCCLGVLCDIVNPDGWNQNTHPFEADDESYISPEGLERVGLTDEVQRELGSMNDEKMPFADIADFIEESV